MPYIHIEGVLVYAEDDGCGEPVLLLHGGFDSLEHLRPLGSILARTSRVLSFERPGHGRSPDVCGGYSYEQGVAQALAFLDVRGVEAAHIVGFSDGAIIGLLLALRCPKRVRSLVSISGNLNPSAFNDSADDGVARILLPLPEISDGCELAVGDDVDIEREHYERLSPDGPEHADVVLDKLFTLWTGEPQIDPLELRAIVAPTLIMSADRDTIRPDHSLLMAASIPGAQLCIVPGATHDLVADRPDLVHLVVAGFLEGLRK